MDEIMSVNPNEDTTFTILLEAQNQGHEIFYYLPSELNFVDEKLFANVKKVKLSNSNQNSQHTSADDALHRLESNSQSHCQIINSEYCDLTKFDAILVRQDPPFDMNYITSTYLLEKIKDQILILNDPTEIRNCSEKLFVLDFPDLTPRTLITSSLKEVEKFHQEEKKIILKPLYSSGGDGVFFVTENDKNISAIVDLLLKNYHTPLIAQQFIPDVKNGDKRILLLDGEIFGVLNRVAKEGEIRSNLHAGGTAAKADLTKRDLEICQKLAPELKKRGLFFVGIDVIGDFVTEINVTSPMGIAQINRLYSTKIEKELIEKLVEKIKNFKKSA